MAAELAPAMAGMTLNTTEEDEVENSTESIVVQFKESGGETFDVELEPKVAFRDVKKLLAEECNIEPEHMRLIYDGKILKEGDTVECFDAERKIPVQILYRPARAASARPISATEQPLLHSSARYPWCQGLAWITCIWSQGRHGYHPE